MNFFFLILSKIYFIVLMIILKMNILKCSIISMKLCNISIEMSIIYFFIYKFILIFQLLLIKVQLTRTLSSQTHRRLNTLYYLLLLLYLRCVFKCTTCGTSSFNWVDLISNLLSSIW